MHALIVDDNAYNLSILSRMLSMEGVSSIDVIDPAALDVALTDPTPIDVVFLDLELPGVNGLEVFEYLKANDRFRQVPIIACSIHISEINTVRKQGFQGFIGKPLDSDKFPKQLRQILGGEEVWSR